MIDGTITKEDLHRFMASHSEPPLVRAKVEHVFLVIKRIFGWSKVRYRGLAKNTHWLVISCGLANRYMARRPLLAVA